MVGNRSVTYLVWSALMLLVTLVAVPASAGRSRGPMRKWYSVAMTHHGEYVVNPLTPEGMVDLGDAQVWCRRHGEGLVFDRVASESWSLQFSWDTTPSSQVLIDEARAAVVAQLVADGYGTSPGFSAEKLAAGDYSVSAHSLRGYVLDATAYLVLIGAGVAWVQGLLWAGRADARDARARLDHICINCGYDTRGLRSTKCPECGREF